MNIRTIPEPQPVLADGTVPLTAEWDTGNVRIKGPSAIYTSSTAPLSPYTGMLWNDTSIASRKMIRSWNGTAWGVASGYETSSRTISLIHDHGSLITSEFLSSYFNENVGKVGAAEITIEIDNKTYKTFASGASVDAGGGLVKLPIASGHGFLAGERVCIDGTVNYDGVFVINSVEDTYIIIPATYVAETIPADAVVRVVIESIFSFTAQTNKVTLKAKTYLEQAHQKQSVVFYTTGGNGVYFDGVTRVLNIRGIKAVAPNGIGFQLRNSAFVLCQYCSCVASISLYGFLANYGTFANFEKNSVKTAGFAFAAFFGATAMSNNCVTVSNVNYGLFADYGGTIKKTSATQPTGSMGNELAITSRGGQII